MAGSDGSSCKFRGSDATDDATRGVLVVECVARGDGQTRTSVRPLSISRRDATMYRTFYSTVVMQWYKRRSRYVQRSW
jgi:hypothetical protein